MKVSNETFPGPSAALRPSAALWPSAALQPSFRTHHEEHKNVLPNLNGLNKEMKNKLLKKYLEDKNVKKCFLT